MDTIISGLVIIGLVIVIALTALFFRIFLSTPFGRYQDAFDTCMAAETTTYEQCHEIALKAMEL